MFTRLVNNLFVLSINLEPVDSEDAIERELISFRKLVEFDLDKIDKLNETRFKIVEEYIQRCIEIEVDPDPTLLRFRRPQRFLSQVTASLHNTNDTGAYAVYPYFPEPGLFKCKINS